MLKPSLITEFIEKNKLPIKQAENKTIGCIEYSKTNFKLRFPGGCFGIISVFLAGSYLYGFRLDLPSFQKLLPTSTHPENCFHVKELLKRPNEFKLNKTDLEKINNLLEKPRTKTIKEKVLFIIYGSFTLKGGLTIETYEGKEQVRALMINLDDIIEFIKNLCQKAVENRAIKLQFNLGVDYLTQVMLDLFQDHLWQSVVKHYKGIPIYKVAFSSSGKYKITEFGKV